LGAGTAEFKAGVVYHGVQSALSVHWRDIWQSVVHGAEDVANVVVTVADDVAKTVTHTINTVDNDVKKTYALVIDSVEAAVTAVASILKTIAKDIKSAVEWLSYVFNWDDMVRNAGKIAMSITDRLTAFSTWVDSEKGSVNTYLDQVFGDVEQTVENAFSSVLKSIGGTTLQANQQANNNPQTVYSANGTSTYTKTQWMNTKINNNVGQTQTSDSVTATAADPFLDAAESFIGTVKEKLASSYQNLPNSLQQSFSNLGNLMKDPRAFVLNLVSAVLEAIENAIVLLIEFVKDVLEAFVDSLSVLITGAVSLITQTIKIPVIGTLWDVITKSAQPFPLSFLNLFSLLVSIPATIITKAFSGAGAQDTGLGPFGEDILTTGKVVAGLVNAGFDTLSDVANLNSDGGVALTLIALDAIIFGLSFPQPLPKNDALSYVWWVASALPVVYAAYLYRANKKKYGSYQLVNAQNNSTNGLFGALMIGFSAIGAKADPGDFDGPNHLTLVGNLFSYIPYFGKAFAEGPATSPQRIGVGIVDGVGDVSSAIVAAIASA
jgi:hypothetical protein